MVSDSYNSVQISAEFYITSRVCHLPRPGGHPIQRPHACGEVDVRKADLCKAQYVYLAMLSRTIHEPCVPNPKHVLDSPTHREGLENLVES